MNDLVPEIRTDKNGKQTTRWVKPPTTVSLRNLLPSPSLSAPEGEIPADELYQTVKEGVAKRGGMAWLDDDAEVDDAYNFTDYKLLQIFAANVHTDERLADISRLRTIIAKEGYRDTVGILTPENIAVYKPFEIKLDNLYINVWDEDVEDGNFRGNKLRALFLASSREDQLLIEGIVGNRGIYEYEEVKSLLSELKQTSNSISSGLL